MIALDDGTDDYAIDRSLYQESEAEFQSLKEQLDKHPTGFSPLGDHVEDAGLPFLPSPMEIERRKQQLKWLQGLRFSEDFIFAIMWHDNPCFDMVERVVNRKVMSEDWRVRNKFKPTGPVTMRMMRRAAKQVRKMYLKIGIER